MAKVRKMLNSQRNSKWSSDKRIPEMSHNFQALPVIRYKLWFKPVMIKAWGVCYIPKLIAKQDLEK